MTYVYHAGDGKHAVIFIDGIRHDLNNAYGEHFTYCTYCTYFTVEEAE